MSVYHSLFVLVYYFGHCILFSSSIYGFWLPLYYLQAQLVVPTLEATLNSFTNLNFEQVLQDSF
jgi:hypothetical protein